MEVVTIEKRTFSYVCERFTEFAKRIESLCSTHTQKVENWLDSQEVCLLLGVSKRTCSITEVAEDWLILKLVVRFIIRLPILKELLQTVKRKINHPNTPRLMKELKKIIRFSTCFPLLAHGKALI